MRSRGAFEFRTKPSDFGRMGAEIRLLAERGETHLLPMGISETMVATNASYSQELFDISCRVFGPVMGNRWDRDRCLHEEIMISDITMAKMKNMYSLAKQFKIDMSRYVAVSRGKDYDSIVDYAKRIFLASGNTCVQAWTFLMDGDALYVRRFFLESFKTGLDILNVIRFQERVREANKNNPRKYTSNRFFYKHR